MRSEDAAPWKVGLEVACVRAGRKVTSIGVVERIKANEVIVTYHGGTVTERYRRDGRLIGRREYHLREATDADRKEVSERDAKVARANEQQKLATLAIEYYKAGTLDWDSLDEYTKDRVQDYQRQKIQIVLDRATFAELDAVIRILESPK
jgi:hypothetical protein